jgi:hypothetical protein
MPNRYTATEPCWRVQVQHPDKIITNNCLFHRRDQADIYYDALYIKGSKKRIQERGRFCMRYYTIKQEDMS